MRQAIQAKLEQIIFEEVKLSGRLPLGEVVKYLDAEARKLDPEKRGLNFVISTAVTPRPALATLLRTAEPSQPTAVEQRLRRLQEQSDEQAERVMKAQAQVDRLRQKLNIPDTAAEGGQASTLGPETIRRLEGERINALAAHSQISSLLTNLLKLDRAQLRNALPTAWPDALLTELLSRLAQAEQELGTLLKSFAEDHPSVDRVKQLLKTLDAQIEQRVGGVLAGLTTKAESLKGELAARAKELDLANQRDIENAQRWAPYFLAKRDLEMQKQIRQTLMLRLAQEKIDAQLPKTAPPDLAAKTGLPEAPMTPEPVDLNAVTINLALPLRNVRLKDVLEVITKVADYPLQYAVNDYGVLFSTAAPGPAMVGPAGPEIAAPAPIQTRLFKLDTNSFWAGLEKQFGITLGEPSLEADFEVAKLEIKLRQAEFECDSAEKRFQTASISREDFNRIKANRDLLVLELKQAMAKKAVEDRAQRLHQAQSALFLWLTQLGANMEAPDKALFYNERTGTLTVRATVEELARVQAAVEQLGGKASRN
jgi:hypothetical protein